jgi:hypothetical protein
MRASRCWEGRVAFDLSSSSDGQYARPNAPLCEGKKRNERALGLPMTLDALMHKHGSDKASWHHNYTPVYERLFQSFKDERVNVLEIGIGSVDPSVPSSTGAGRSRRLMQKHGIEYRPGASLRAWETYFGKGTIYAIDIDEKALVNEGRIRSFVCDSTSPRDVACLMDRLGVRFDIIVDDGLHSFDAQLSTFLQFFPHLAEGGIYVTEDLYNSRRKLYPERFMHEIGNHIRERWDSCASFELLRGRENNLRPANVNLLVVAKRAGNKAQSSFDGWEQPEAPSTTPTPLVQLRTTPLIAPASERAAL